MCLISSSAAPSNTGVAIGTPCRKLPASATISSSLSDAISAFWPPVFDSWQSKAGGLLCFVYFLLVLPAGTRMRDLTELKPHVLRYWEGQFRFLHPAKNRSGNRVYSRREVELIQLVKHLLYTEKYTIEGARQKLDQRRRGGELRSAARAALEAETLDSIERRLAEILTLLEPGTPARE